MSALIFLVPVSLALATLFVVVCLVSIRSGQFDDLESPRWRMLFDSGDGGTRGFQGINGESAGSGPAGAPVPAGKAAGRTRPAVPKILPTLPEPQT